jgi:hypothetical protein
MPFSINTIYAQIFKIWRKRRFALFLNLLKPRPSDTLLDVGGYPSFWLSYPQPVRQIDALNVHEVSWTNTDKPHYNIRTLVGDGCALAMADRSYDIGFSNSVIEHVGTWENQQRFASELRRVARRLWVQTPAYEFPIEPHYLAPFVHYLPRAVQKRIIRWCTLRGWIERPDRVQIDSMVDTTRLLRKSEMKQLFPDCQIVVERTLGIFPKSYIAVRTNG